MSSWDLETYLTYDDVYLLPQESDILPSEVDTKTFLARDITLNIPLVSAAMDTVTESRLATTIAQLGGIGIIHKNMAKEKQAYEVEQVKRCESLMIVGPVTVGPDMTLQEVKNILRVHRIASVLVINDQEQLIGILTHRDMEFEDNYKLTVRQLMTPQERLITAPVGVDLQQAKTLLQKNRIEKLPVVDAMGRVRGLITIKDIKNAMTYPSAARDNMGRLRVGAAVGVGEKELARAEALVKAGVDCLVVDSAHGHSLKVFEQVRELRHMFPNLALIAGNVVTVEACQKLYEAGVDGVKVGVGPGSICTTRVIAGVGVPQLTAVKNCASFCRDHKLGIIADGGLKYSGDIVKALAAGATSVMLGSLFAGTDETPGENILYQGRSYKLYRGMGSLGAMGLGSKDRYGQGEVKEAHKLVPEGVEAQVPYRGPLYQTVYQLVGGLRSGMGYVGAATVDELYKRAKFIRVSSAGLSEGHPHDVAVIKDAPNYTTRN
jgi:IMP dehydrogenase